MEISYDDIENKELNVKLSFQLPAGCYATTLLREILHNNSII